jgi:hypothetical protein
MQILKHHPSEYGNPFGYAYREERRGHNQQSAISNQQSAISHQPSAISHQYKVGR